MREAINFVFNNISSEDMGVHIASTSSGLYEDLFLPNRRIIEEKTPYSKIPHFQGFELEPLSFPLTFYIYEWQERDNLRQIAKWLFQDYYAPLSFDTNPDRIFYAIIEGSSKLMHNGTKQGYIEFNIRCNSPFSYSPVQRCEKVEFRDGHNKVTIYNVGDMRIKPKMWITKKGSNGSVYIKNEATNQTAILDNLKKDETVFIDFATEDIVSSDESKGVYRFDDFNNVWLELCDIEENTLSVTGDCDIAIEYQMVYLAD